MTNTKFRKRALLSSVAMLLVALIALGSATFAWFTSNPDADASGLNIKANSSVGLVLRSQTEKAQNSDWWSHNAGFRATAFDSSTKTFTYNTASMPMTPVSMAQSGTNKGTLYTASANDSGAYDPKDNYTTTTANQEYFKEELELKITGSDTAQAVKLTGCNWTPGDGNLHSAVRVAVLDGTNILATFSESATTNDCANAPGAVATNTTTDGLTTTAKAASGLTVDCGTWTTKTLTIIVYLDGAAENVFTDNIADADISSLLSNLTFSFHAGT